MAPFITEPFNFHWKLVKLAALLTEMVTEPVLQITPPLLAVTVGVQLVLSVTFAEAVELQPWELVTVTV